MGGPRKHAKFTHHRKLYLMGSMDGISSNKFRKRIIMCELFLKWWLKSPMSVPAKLHLKGQWELETFGNLLSPLPQPHH